MLVRRALWFGRAAGGLVVVAVLLATAALASPGATERFAKNGGTFRVTTSFVDTIDPALDGGGLLGGAACGTLMAFPDRPVPGGLRPRPELAEAEPVVSRDGKTYAFTVREDARFSTGAAVTARAFARALERIRDPAMRSREASVFEDVRTVVAKGRTLTLRLTRPDPLLLGRMAALCAVPPSLPADPEGAKAPLPSAAPYYAAEYLPGERVVVERNRFYRGSRLHHVDRFVVDLAADPNSAVDDIASGRFDCCVQRSSDIAAAAAELAQRYGVNRSQFWIAPGMSLRMFVLNTSRPLFRNNPQLRQAVNFAVDRRALTRELGAHIGRATDQYLLPVMPGFHDERIYPLKGPDLDNARARAKGNRRGAKAILYAPNLPARVAGAQVIQENLKAIGLEVELVLHPPNIHFQKLATPGEPFDIADVGTGPEQSADPSFLNVLFHGRSIGPPIFGNPSYFDSPRYNRLLEQASRLTGTERYRTYRKLDLLLSRDAAPAIPFAALNAAAFVSRRTGCVIMNPFLNLTAVCLK